MPNDKNIDHIIKKYFDGLTVDIIINSLKLKRNIVINDDKCVCCGLCIDSCIVNAMEIGPFNKPQINNNCVYCGKCKETCPFNAISIYRTIGKYHNGKIKIENFEKYNELQYNKKKCINCKVCLRTCPFNAILDDEYKLKFNMEKCTLCGNCEKLCPTKCITIK